MGDSATGVNFSKIFFHLPLPYWSWKMRHCETSHHCDVGCEFRDLMELMVEFIFVRASNTFVRSSLHWAAAAHTATPARYNLPPCLPEWPGTPPPPGAKGWGGKDMSLIEPAFNS